MAVHAGVTPRHGIRRATARWLSESHPAGLMHGAVIMGAVLALVSEEDTSPEGVAGAAALVLVIYWLTFAYTDALGHLTGGERAHLMHRLVRYGVRDLAVPLGGLPALLTMTVWLSFGSSLTAAVNAALWLTVVLLAAVGYLAAHMAGVIGWRLLGETFFAALFGAVMITLNTWLH
jgi:hypothetical protein